jgi:hypothetical protein
MIALIVIAASVAAGWHDAYLFLPIPALTSIVLAMLDRWALNRRVKREWDEDGLSENASAVLLKDAIGSVGCVSVLSVVAFFLASLARGWLN